MSLTIQLAEADHLPALLALCRAASAAPGSTWNEFYPDEEILREDIEAARLFRVLAEGNLVGVFAMGDIGELNDFVRGDDGDRPLEFARLAIAPQFQGKGFAKEAVRLAIERASEMGATVLRLLVAVCNPAAQAVYKNAGFEFGKTVFMYGHDYVYARKRLS